VGASGAVFIEVDDRVRAEALLLEVPGVTRVTIQGDGLVVEQSDGSRADLAAALVGGGLRLETIMATQRLEEAFLELLDGAGAPPPPGAAPPSPPPPPPTAAPTAGEVTP